MNKEELFKKVKEIETEKNKLYFINTLPIDISDRAEYQKALNLKSDIDAGLTLDQLKEEAKTEDALKLIEDELYDKAIALAEREEIEKITLRFDVSPFITRNGKLSEYAMLEDFYMRRPGKLYIVNYKELVNKIKELGYEISIKTTEEMRTDNIPTNVRIICNFTDINEEKKEKKNTKVLGLERTKKENTSWNNSSLNDSLC